MDRYELLAAARKELRAMRAEREAIAMARNRSFERDKTAQAYRDGIAAEACDRAEDAIFEALNVLTNHCDDERAQAVLRS